MNEVTSTYYFKAEFEKGGEAKGFAFLFQSHMRRNKLARVIFISKSHDLTHPNDTVYGDEKWMSKARDEPGIISPPDHLIMHPSWDYNILLFTGNYNLIFTIMLDLSTYILHTYGSTKRH